jgi:hypothetical protein
MDDLFPQDSRHYHYVNTHSFASTYTNNYNSISFENQQMNECAMKSIRILTLIMNTRYALFVNVSCEKQFIKRFQVNGRITHRIELSYKNRKMITSNFMKV